MINLLLEATGYNKNKTIPFIHKNCLHSSLEHTKTILTVTWILTGVVFIAFSVLFSRTIFFIGRSCCV